MFKEFSPSSLLRLFFLQSVGVFKTVRIHWYVGSRCSSLLSFHLKKQLSSRMLSLGEDQWMAPSMKGPHMKTFFFFLKREWKHWPRTKKKKACTYICIHIFFLWYHLNWVGFFLPTHLFISLQLQCTHVHSPFCCFLPGSFLSLSLSLSDVEK